MATLLVLQEKCARYWPQKVKQELSLSVAKLTVKLISEEKHPLMEGLIMRKLQVMQIIFAHSSNSF